MYQYKVYILVVNMPEPYTEDLRVVIFNHLDKQKDVGQISSNFGVGKSTIYNWKKLKKEKGTLKLKKGIKI